jgi:hypothetical protein
VKLPSDTEEYKINPESFKNSEKCVNMLYHKYSQDVWLMIDYEIGFDRKGFSADLERQKWASLVLWHGEKPDFEDEDEPQQIIKVDPICNKMNKNLHEMVKKAVLEPYSVTVTTKPYKNPKKSANATKRASPEKTEHLGGKSPYIIQKEKNENNQVPTKETKKSTEKL